jgi:hypothetical protein
MRASFVAMDHKGRKRGNALKMSHRALKMFMDIHEYLHWSQLA